MQVDVGTALTYRGRNYICIAIEQFDLIELAKEDSNSMKTWLHSGDNVKVLEQSICDFNAGDIIHKVGERLTLECPGVDIQFLWVKYTITLKGDENDGINRIETPHRESTDNQAESTRLGDSSREGDGEESVGEAGPFIHRDGSAGEGGIDTHSEDGKGCKPAVT